MDLNSTKFQLNVKLKKKKKLSENYLTLQMKLHRYVCRINIKINIHVGLLNKNKKNNSTNGKHKIIENCILN